MTYTSEEEELRSKMKALCIQRYGVQTKDTMRRLFESYDTTGDKALDQDEMYELLSDADVGYRNVSRGKWVQAIFDKVDKSPKDGRLTWEEYLAASSTFGSSTDPQTPSGTVPAKPVTPALPDLPQPQTGLEAPFKAAIAIGGAVLLGSLWS